MSEATAGRLPQSAQRPAGDLGLSLRLARRELRGGLRGFRIFLACLMLGVAAIAGVGSLSQAVLSGLQANGRALLGGEMELRLTHRAATPEESAWLSDNSRRLSQTAELRTMARNPAEGGSRRLVELKGVDPSYPLHGNLVSEPVEPNGNTVGLLAPRDGVWGALVDRGLLARLGLSVGDRLGIGEIEYEIRGTVAKEPDRAARAFTLGPRVMVDFGSLEETGLLQPGSLIRYHYRLDLPQGENASAWTQRLNADLPQAGWRLRDLSNAAPGLRRFVDQTTLFMTLVGLTSLLVGGVGVANAVRSFLEEKKATIATLKCLGAPSRLIFQTYLAQVSILAVLGIAAGLVVGAVMPLLVGPMLGERLGFDLDLQVFLGPLAMAALFGILITLVFSLWPLARAQQIPAASLFRDSVQPVRKLPPVWAMAAVAAATLALIGAAVLGTDNTRFALGFIAGAAAALLAFRLCGAAVTWIARKLPRARHPGLRLAVANLHRPGAPTASVITSLGLGLTVLIAIALIEGNLKGQVLEDMPEEAPGFYFIDIQPDQVEEFDALVSSQPGVEELTRVPMLRGRISAVNGTPPEAMEIPEDIAWIFRGDRGLTWSRTPSEGTRILEGSWWPADYDGPPLVSLDAEVGTKLGLHPGDRLTINILGRDVEVEIANLREIRWSDLTINFVMIFSPGLLERAPQSHIATVHLDPAGEDALEGRVIDAFPNVSAIRVKEALASFAEILDNIAVALSATAGVTLIAGILVLAGAVAAGRQRRIYDAVVLKVLGATRARVAGAFLLEYGLIGLITAGVATLFGTVAAWWVLTDIMNADDFAFMAPRVALTALGATAITLAFGFAGTWRALSHKSAPLLRNE